MLIDARSHTYRAVNATMVQAYMEIGRIMVEDQQKGEKRAAYGEEVVNEISKRLTADFGKGFTPTNLKYMRQFYLTFSIGHAVSDQSLEPICHSLRDQFPTARNNYPFRLELTWTHYRTLIKIEDEKARLWYMNEAADQNWSTRQLERQINTHYYNRVLASRDKVPVIEEAKEKLAGLPTEEFIRDPYVLEFLNLQDYPALRESDLEQALINKLQYFLLELGKGFSFVARQRRIRVENDDYYIDLVFYNYLLKCFVLIELKTGKLSHQDIGQMDFYVRYFEKEERTEGDNPTIGIILCAEKSEAMVKYTLLQENDQIFASKYKLYLPSEEEFKAELLRERRLVELEVLESGKEDKE